MPCPRAPRACPAGRHHRGGRRDHHDGNRDERGRARDRAAARDRPVRQRRPPQQRGAADDQPELEDAAHHVQRADRFRTVQVGTERQAGGARQHVHHDDDGVPGDAERQPEPRGPPQQDRRPDQLRPGDHQEEHAVQGVFGEVLEHDREVDGRRTDGERRQATKQVRPGSGWPGADLLVRGDRSAHTTNARLPVIPPASATRPMAEQSLLAGQRPLLVSSRLEDPEQNLQFTEGKLLTVRGGEAALESQ